MAPFDLYTPLVTSLSVLYIIVPICASPRPAAAPIPYPLPEPTPSPQSITIYGPFSGAIFIIGPQGAPQYSSAYPAQCPAQAPSVCSNVNAWNWCCPTGCSCAVLPNSVVGCCPSGQSCDGFNGQITTLSIASQPAAVFATAAPSIVTNAPFNPNGGQSVGPSNNGGAYIQTIPGGNSAGGNGGVFIVGPPGHNGGNGGNGGNMNSGSVSTGYYSNPYNFAACTTMTMVGAPLPTYRQAPCGTMLIVPPPPPLTSSSVRVSTESLLAVVLMIIPIWLRF